jgi:hypothetical protein
LQEVTDLLMRRLAETGGLSTAEVAPAFSEEERQILPLVAPAVSA